MGKVYLGNQEISPTVSIPVAKDKFGATVDSFIGDVNENGVLSKPTKKTSIVFDGVKDIGLEACNYTFYQKINITSVSFPVLTMISGNGACNSMFASCSNLTSVSFPVLTMISGNGACNSMFSRCFNLTSVSFPALTTISINGACNSMFSSCSNLTSVSFPALTTISSNVFGSASYNYMFAYCTALTEIHFRADAQATIEAMTGYSAKWGATNATIYFDL